MKRRNFLLAMTIFCIALLSSQSMLAKKLVYLGHNYEGKAKSKVPEGEGQILVGGLKITGFFNANTVTRAVVTKENETVNNVALIGTVIFDESDIITLKAYGTIRTYYFTPVNKLLISDRNYIDNPINEDYKTSVTDSIFTPTELKKQLSPMLKRLIENNKFKFKLDPDYERFNFSTSETSVDVQDSYIMKLQDVIAYDNNDNRMEIKAFYDDSYRKLSSARIINPENYKDKEGRIWKFRNPQNIRESEWIVTYPNGSWFSHKYKDEYDSFELHYPDGKIVKPIKKGTNYFVKVDDDLWVYVYGLKDYLDIFLESAKQDHIVMIPTSRTYIYSESLDISNMSEQDVDLFFKEKVFPYYKNIQSNNVGFSLLKNLDSYASDNVIAEYNQGKVSIRAKVAAKANENIRKSYFDCVNILKKAYGAKYVDAALNGRLIVGMPLDLLQEYKFWDEYNFNYFNNDKNKDFTQYTWLVGKVNSSVGLYRVTLQRKPSIILARYKVWVRNGKITEFFDD